jgi:hypothetical protein
VNGTAISTGAYPAHDGILANKEYRPEIDPLKFIHTEDMTAARAGDATSHGHYVRLPTLAEIIRRAGGKAVVAGAKPVALLADRADRTNASAGINLFAGQTLPSTILETLKNKFGEFPILTGTNNPTRNDWTTQALIDTLWKDGVPEFSFLWMNEPDLSQHMTGPGSERSLAAIRNADDNLDRVLKTLAAKGVRDTTDVLVVSDHGFSTVSSSVDLVDSLLQAGINATRQFKATPASGEVLVISNAGSVLIYVIGHEPKMTQQVVDFLQGWSHTGVIFTRQQMPGTFSLNQIHVDAATAPDVLVSMRWTADKNDVGVPGMLTSDGSDYGPGQGMHVSLSHFDMHNTLIAAGPDFRSGVFDALPTGNVDVAPTVLWILGIQPPQKMDGRVLTEALTVKGPKINSFEPGHIETEREQKKSVWHQYLNFTEVNGVVYYDEGNGYQTPK